MRRLLAGAFAALALLGAGMARAEVPVPPLSSPVTDLTATLSREQIAALEQRLRAFEARKGSQVAVLIVPTTRPETIEQYAIRVAEAWKPGRRGVDDGALLLVAKDDRELRIEVGYGLEGALPDAAAKRIIEETILPRLRQGDFFGGISAGVERMIGVIEGEPLPEPRAASRDRGGNWDALIFGAFMLVAVAGAALRKMLGRLPAASIIGGVIGVGAWVAIGSLAFALVVAVAAFVLTLAGGISGGHYAGRSGRYGGGGWSGGRGGGWSGGGGGFGGGGASGRW